MTAHLDDGTVLRLILKDLTWDRLLGDARRTKPRFLYEPRRCIETYRRILATRGVAAACYGAFTDEPTGRYWLLIEKVPGVELWQVGDLGVWESVARWLDRFHRDFAEEGGAGDAVQPHLLRYDGDFLRIWRRGRSLPGQAVITKYRAEPIRYRRPTWEAPITSSPCGGLPARSTR